MSLISHDPRFADDLDTDEIHPVDLVSLAAAAAEVVGDSSSASLTAENVVGTAPPVGIPEPQLDDGCPYGRAFVYGSNITKAWHYSSGAGVAVGLVDDGFDPAATATFGNFSTALSKAFGGTTTSVVETAGGYHGTTTAGLIGAAGVDHSPEGLAPNASIVGVKVTFSTATIAILAQAEAYAASVSSVVNNSWGYTGFGVGEPDDPSYAVWYDAIQTAVADDRGGLGDVITFAAGNDRQDGNDLAVQPIVANYRVIAVAATNTNGTVGYYSDPGAALLTSAIGANVAVINTSGSGSSFETGTSYAAPAVAAIAAMILAVNPRLGWRDVQQILADASYMPAPSAASFTYNGATDWNGGGMHFSDDLGFGVIDANVAVNLARSWTAQSTSADMATATVTNKVAFSVGKNETSSSTVANSANIRIQHVEVTIDDTYLPVAWSKLTLISPDKTQSVLVDQIGLVNGTDETGGLDISGDTITSNAFWGENSTGTWTLDVEDINGSVVGQIDNWSLTFLGDDAATVQMPLVYTPEFASIATSARTIVAPGTATTIDLSALPNATTINLNGGAGMIDGVAVFVDAGLRNANADASTGWVNLTGLSSGGSELTGGDNISALSGSGDDTINAGLGRTAISTGAGGSTITLSPLAASDVTIKSGGADTIYAGLAAAWVVDIGTRGDTIYDQSASLSFINGSGASFLARGIGTVTVQAGSGGGTYDAGTAGGSKLTAGTGVVTFYGEASGDSLTAAGSAADTLIAGSGAEILSGGAATGSITLEAGSGFDKLIAGMGKTTFVLGTSGSHIELGGVSDLIDIRSGRAGGLDVITGFRPGTDFLDLIGLAGSALKSAINTSVREQQAYGAGGTLLTFSGGTKVDLLGVAKVSSSDFA